MEFTPLAKFYTAAGSDGMDKFHLWAHPNPNILFSLQNDPSPTTRIDVQHEGMWGGSQEDLFSSW